MTKTYEIEIDTAVYNPVYVPQLDNVARTQIFYGGSASGKSVFLAQRCVYDLLMGGRNYLVCREIGRTIKHSTFAEISKVIGDWGLKDLFNIIEFEITCANGYQILFLGLDDVEKVKSITPKKGVITDIWIEEATECDKATVKNLYKRQRGGSEDTPKRLTMSFNPILQSHWIYQDYFAGISWTDSQAEYKSEGLSILKTTYKDNRFLTEADKKDLEDESDTYLYNVYTLGNWGILGHVIFTNWKVQDLSGMVDQFTNHKNGLDFGFADDPAALWVSHYDRSHKTIYVYDELYETGLTNPDLARSITDKIGKQLVTCDSAEPKSIVELQTNGVIAKPAKKGKDSVTFGIQWLQQQTIILDARCINARNEISTYHWKEDAGGNALPVPVDKNNHLIDAGRYALEDDMVGGWLVM